jgi:hypothetical protein
MSALEQIGAFAGGVAQGVPQGMNIYQQYNQMRDEGEKRARTKRVESKVQSLFDQGAFDDPVNGIAETKKIWLEEGDADQYVKYDQLERQLRKQAKDKIGLDAFSIGQRDPIAGFEYLNEHADTMNPGVTYAVTPDGDGFSVATTANGKTTVVKAKDRDQLEHLYLSGLAPQMFDDLGDYGTYQKTQAETQKATAQASREAGMAQWDPLKAQADIQQSIAAAGASGATAHATMAKLPGEIAKTQAQTRQADAAAAAAGKEADPDVAQYVHQTQSDTSMMDPGEIPYYQDPTIRAAIGSAIKTFNPNLSGSQAGGISDQLLRAPGFDADPATGEVVLDNGTRFSIGPSAIQQLMDARGMAAPAEE